MATPWDPKPAELYTQPPEVQNTLNYLVVLMGYSQQRLAALKAVHDPLVAGGSSPTQPDESVVAATGEAITKEEEIQREAGDYRNRIISWAANDQSYWALKMPRPAFPAPPAAIPAALDNLPPLPHLTNPAYFAGMRAAVTAFVPVEQHAAAEGVIAGLEKSAA